jgi:cation diffusion facilitator CzcD-associated flavoprotein CzcO
LDNGSQAGRVGPRQELEVVIVGGGFAGIYMLYRVRELGLTVRLLEAGDGIGGTWYWNRYPGARCDIESFDYSYSFSPELEQEWEWTERYPSQPEILRYINHVADRFDLRRDIQLETRVTRVELDETTGRWEIHTDGGERFSATYAIMAVGCLSAPKEPDIPGLDRFEGELYRTSDWPREGVDLAGKRVGVIGTGSTGVQIIPKLAGQAGHVTVFQRTPNFSLPARNAPLTPGTIAEVKAGYAERRRKTFDSDLGLPVEIGQQAALEVTEEERLREYDSRWAVGGGAFLLAFNDLLIDKAANDTAGDYFRARIREKVDDPEAAEILTPTTYPVGTKRLCLDTDYYETFNRDNVSIVDLRRSPIGRATPRSLVTSAAEYPLDVIVLAIGFDAVTGALVNADIRGVGGLCLADKWAGGPRTYLGVGIAGFPNLFTVTGPGSPSIVTNVVVSIEQHVDWIANCIAYLREHGIESIEPTTSAEDEWVEHVREVAEATLFPLADSWYVGANVPGKPRVFMPYLGGVANFRKLCDDVVSNDYRGFTLRERVPVREG